MAKPEYLLRNITKSDFEQVTQILLDFQMTENHNDIEIAFNTDQNGIFVAQLSITGEIIGICGGIKISPQFSYISFYAVKSDYQNLGIGCQLWSKVIEHLGKQTNIGLAAEEPMRTKYIKQFGSAIVDNKRSGVRFSKPNPIQYELLINSISNISIICVNDKNVKSVIDYDREVFGFSREPILRVYMIEPKSVFIAAIDQTDNEIVGYSKLSINQNKYTSAQPLYANSLEIAELLLSHGLRQMSNYCSEGFTMYSWKNNSRTESIVRKLGLIKRESDYTKIYTKNTINCSYDKIYARTTPTVFPY